MTELRFARSRARKNTGRKAEAAASKTFGARQVPGSGGVGRGEGDFKTTDLLFEHKATTHDSYRLTRRELMKADREAHAVGKRSAFVVSFVDDGEKLQPPGRVVIMSERAFNALVGKREEERK